MLPLAAINAVVMMAVAVAVAALGAAPFPVAVHLAFALGILPLIVAAIIYFVPVLTRGAGAPRWINAMPACCWLGGLLMVAGMAGLLRYTVANLSAALFAGAAALVTLRWIDRRARGTLGKPHPGLPWYVAALIFLLLALLSVPLMLLWPHEHGALRLFHLHANLLGLVGLSAIGTLQVLLPTTLGRPDPDAARRLMRDLKFSVAGAGLIALGAAWNTPLAVAGTALYLVAPVRMAASWLGRFGRDVGRMHGAGSSLVISCLALIALCAAGVAHAGDALAGRDAVIAFVVAFLLPLVTGAAAQLLPVWLRPGPQQEWHARLRASLSRFSGLRSLLFALGGFALALGWHAGLWLALAGFALILAALAASARHLR